MGYLIKAVCVSEFRLFNVNEIVNVVVFANPKLINSYMIRSLNGKKVTSISGKDIFDTHFKDIQELRDEKIKNILYV